MIWIPVIRHSKTIRVGSHSETLRPAYKQKSQASKLSLLIVNCCSITNKKLKLETLISLHNIDILIGTESHLDDSILNSEIFPPGFSVYRNDRNRHGGGVLILVKNTIASSQLHLDSSPELVWIRVHTGNNKDIIIASFYCPPHSHIWTLYFYNAYKINSSICTIVYWWRL